MPLGSNTGSTEYKIPVQTGETGQGSLGREVTPQPDQPVVTAPDQKPVQAEQTSTTTNAPDQAMADAMAQIDEASVVGGNSRPVDGVIQAGGEPLKIGVDQAVRNNDHFAIEDHLATNNGLIPEPEEAEVLPEEADQDLVPQQVAPPAIIDPKITPEQAAEPILPPTEPPQLTSDPAPIAASATPAPDQSTPLAPTEPSNETIQPLPQPVMPDQAPVVSGNGLEQVESPRLNSEMLENLNIEQLNKLIDDQEKVVQQTSARYREVLANPDPQRQDLSVSLRIYRRNITENAYLVTLRDLLASKEMEQLINRTEQGSGGGVK